MSETNDLLREIQAQLQRDREANEVTAEAVRQTNGTILFRNRNAGV